MNRKNDFRGVSCTNYSIFQFPSQAIDAAKGMEFLHEHKPSPILHRDLKSDNLLLDENGLVKVWLEGLYLRKACLGHDICY